MESISRNWPGILAVISFVGALAVLFRRVDVLEKRSEKQDTAIDNLKKDLSYSQEKFKGEMKDEFKRIEDRVDKVNAKTQDDIKDLDKKVDVIGNSIHNIEKILARWQGAEDARNNRHL